LLKAGESQVMELSVNKYQLASYDDLGKIEKSSYVVEKGDYKFFIGGSVAEAEEIDYTYAQDDDEIYEKLSEKLNPVSLKKRLLADGTYEDLPTGPARDKDECIFEKMVPGTEEAMVPEEKGRARYLLMNPYK
ncbi:beta-glucosidase, partial [Escherichia coli]|nr:beta-glucosidase [Escherichia coli]